MESYYRIESLSALLHLDKSHGKSGSPLAKADGGGQVAPSGQKWRIIFVHNFGSHQDRIRKVHPSVPTPVRHIVGLRVQGPSSPAFTWET